MKTGKSLTELATELERQSKAKVDYIAPTKELEIVPDFIEDYHSADEQAEALRHPSENIGLRVNGHGTFRINEIAHNQIGERVGIPAKYYDRMRNDASGLLAKNVNHWFRVKPENRLVRLLDGKTRAFLSDSYRPLDNHDLAQVAIQTLTRKNIGVEIASTEITDSRLYIKAVTPKIVGEIRRGDTVQAGIVITNSEVGQGALKIEQMIFRLVCTNGMIAGDTFRRAHIGRKGGQEIEEARQYFKSETRKADDTAFWMKVRDVIDGSFDPTWFEALIEKQKQAASRTFSADPEKVVEATAVKFGLTDDDRSGILRHLFKDDDMTQYGLMNAVTRYSQDVKDYDKATELERLGGRIIELPRTSWTEIAEAEVQKEVVAA